MQLTCKAEETAIKFSPLRSTPIINVPNNVPNNQPSPRSNDVPPSATAAIASNSMPIPAVGWPALRRLASRRPARPAMAPASA
jgi:hypothetical protein